MEKDRDIRRQYVGVFSKIKDFVFKNRKRKITTAITVIVVIFFVWWIFGGQKKQPQYQIATVTKGTVISTVNESGNVASSSQAGVGSPTTGIVTDIYVKDGDTVTQGQNLFKVKSIATAQEIASAYSAYESTVTAADAATQGKITNQSRLEQDRAAVISAGSAVTTMQNNINVSYPNPATKLPYTQNDIDAINSALTSARETFSSDEQKYLESDQAITSVKAAENSAWLAYQATQDSVVTAPIDGTVANILLRTGDQVTASGGNLSSNQSSSSTTSSNNAILYIGHYTRPYIKVLASEVDITSIKAGEKATITLSAFPNKTFVGTVDQVDTAGTISSGVVTYNVFVTFVAPPADIKPGMSSNVTIQTARKDDVLIIPSSAIQTNNGQSTVRILRSGRITSIPVETGITSDSTSEITSGVSEGDTLVTGVSSLGQVTTTGSSPFSGFRGFGGFGGGGRGGGRGG